MKITSVMHVLGGGGGEEGAGRVRGGNKRIAEMAV